MTMKNCATVKMNRKVFELATTDLGPGPAGYGIKTTVGYINRLPTVVSGPVYTVKHRLDLSDETESPGPVYNLAHLTNRGRARAPKYSMGVKLDGPSDSGYPGPAEYKPRGPEKRAKPKILFPLKQLDTRAEYPGPNVYKLPSTMKSRGVTLAKKIDLIPDDESPGPAKYFPVPVNRYKSRAPNITLAKKFMDPLLVTRNNEIKPGPQTYNPTSENKYNRAPRFSFGARRSEKFSPMVVYGDNVIKQR